MPSSRGHVAEVWVSIHSSGSRPDFSVPSLQKDVHGSGKVHASTGRRQSDGGENSSRRRVPSRSRSNHERRSSNGSDLDRKKSIDYRNAYASYVQQCLKRYDAKNPLDFLVLDEIYTFEGRKNQKRFVWTACAFNERGEKLFWVHTDVSTGEEAPERFARQLPCARVIYSDGNPAYEAFFHDRSRVGKGVKTNLIESGNSQFRQYSSRLRRKTKGYTKSLKNLRDNLVSVLIAKVMPSMY